MERPVSTAVSPKKCVLMTGPSVSVPCRRSVASCRRADEREEDLLEGGLLLDVLDLRRRQELLQLGERAVRDDAPLVQDRDPVRELLGLVEVLRGEQHGGAPRRRAPG